MAYFDQHRPAGTGLLGRAIARTIADLAAWREARATRAALSKLTDRELYDIGLSRADLDEMTAPDLRRFPN